MESNQNWDFHRHVFKAIFLLTRHSSVFRWNWKQLTNRNMQGKKVFWHVILHSYFCNAFCKFFIKIEATNVFPKHILELKARDQSIQAGKKLFCHVIVNHSLSNFSWKFLIKIENMWKREVKKQAPLLTLLYRGRLSEAATGDV